VHNCTDLSVAGKGEGMVNKCDRCGHAWPINFEQPELNNFCFNCGNIDINSTRSGLLGQVQRLLTVSYKDGTLPKYLLLENVKNLVGKKFKPQFDAWVNWLDLIGYKTYYKVLNAKHYGIPQNRERIFAVSIRKDVDDGEFKFPDKISLMTRLKDVLEKDVDEKYYLPDERIEKILNSTFVQEKKRIQTTDVCDTLLARDWKDPKCVPVEEPFVVASRGRNPDNPSDRTTGAPTEQRLEPNFSGCTNTLTSVQKDNYVAEPIIYDDYNSRISSDQDAINTLTCNCGASAERNGVKIIEKVAIVEDQFPGSRDARIYENYSPTLRRNCGGLEVANGKAIDNIRWRIRKLTTKESWRLMGFSDSDHDLAAKYVSASALYKQAGNSICTCCLISIFSSLLNGDSSSQYKQYLVNFES